MAGPLHFAACSLRFVFSICLTPFAFWQVDQFNGGEHMIHPLFTRLVTQPGLFAEHAGAYAELAAAEALQLSERLKRQLLLALTAAVCGLSGVGLAGVAAMLAAALPFDSMPAPWALWAVPAVPLAAAAVCGWQLWRMQSVAAFALLRSQFAADVQLLAEVAP